MPSTSGQTTSSTSSVGFVEASPSTTLTATPPASSTPFVLSPDDGIPIDQRLFIFSIDLSPGWHPQKRQSAAYIDTSGQTTGDCTNAVVFSITSDGQLFANTSSGSLQFGTDPGVPYQNFTASATPGSIVSFFSVDPENNLMWANTAFFTNMARFCVQPSGNLLAVFIDPSQAPSDCTFVQLSLNRASQCAGLVPGPPHLVRKGLKAIPAQADLLVPMERKAFKDRRVRKDPKALLAQAVRPVRRERKVLPVPVVPLAHRAHKVLPVPAVLLAHKAHKGSLGPVVRKVWQDRAGHREHKVSQDQADRKELKASQDQVDLQDPKEARVFKVLKEARVSKALKEARVSKALKEAREFRESLDQAGLQALKEVREFKVPKEAREYRELPVPAELQDPREVRGYRESPVPVGLQGPKEVREFKVPKEAR
ncbi:uncharacterized protein AB675_1316, partial [Cyphellophora attinorum]